MSYRNSACLLCEGPSQLAWCEPCHNDMLNHLPRCVCCAKQLPTKTICGKCIKAPPPYQNTRFLYPYQYPVQSLVSLYKYQSQAEIAKSFSHYFIKSQKQFTCLPDAIIAIPLHINKQRQRGFNQSLEFAKALAKTLRIRIITNGLERHKATQPQTLLSPKERLKNVRNAFRAKKTLGRLNHIALVDDVTTTGATAREAAQQIKRQGIENISLWVIAKA